MFSEKKQHEILTPACDAAVHAVCSTGSDTGKHAEAVRPGISAGSGVHLWRIKVEKTDGRRADFARW